MVNIEIEAKMKLDDPAALVKRLVNELGPPVAELVQRDTFYDTPGNDLRASDAGLRLRVVSPVNEPERSEAIITYKGARQAGPLKRREEIELTVGEPAHAAAMLGRLGYTERISVEKRRMRWRMGDCLVEIDRIPYLGHYVEIEGPSEDAVMRVRSALGLDALPLLRDGYVQMLARYLAENGIEERRITFDMEPTSQG